VSRPPVGASVDLGSNSVHLLVAGIHGHALRPLVDESVFLGLGAAIDEQAHLGAARRAQLVEALVRYSTTARQLGAGAITLIGTEPIRLGGAAILPQSLVVLVGAACVVVLLWLFIDRTLLGKAVIATAANRLAARLVGINTGRIVGLSFAVSAAIGAVAGLLVTPIALTSYDVGTLLALKGFAAAMLGGIGSALGAVVGGLLLGMFEAFSAGYVSSKYKDAVAFLVILAVLFAMPQGLLGRGRVERV